MIQIENLYLSYPDKSILDDCSLHVKRGSRVALMGPSGCGKTSLINAVAGLVKPDSGSIEVDGSVSYVFQEPALFPWLTALENINVVLSDSKESLPEAKQWLEAVELGDAAGKYPHELSGGMRQRVAIARALAYDGDILLLDEPLKGLDPELKERMAALILRHSEEKTILLVTHDEWEARTLCEKVYHYKNKTFE